MTIKNNKFDIQIAHLKNIIQEIKAFEVKKTSELTLLYFDITKNMLENFSTEDQMKKLNELVMQLPIFYLKKLENFMEE
ncbi:MAG: hypothetical protein WBA74_08135 [Cyclobacteriaceae bacterium]